MGNTRKFAVLGQGYKGSSAQGSKSVLETPSQPMLVSAAPIVELIERLQHEHEVMALRAPNSDSTACIASILKELAAALERAADVAVFVTVEQASEITGKPTSTVRRLCLKYGKVAGATKVEGSWQIHWPTFEQFLANHPNQEAA